MGICLCSYVEVDDPLPKPTWPARLRSSTLQDAVVAVTASLARKRRLVPVDDMCEIRRSDLFDLSSQRSS